MARGSTLPVYVPGRAAAPGGLKLSSNELPFDPLPSVLAAVLAAAAQLPRYPDHRATALRERIGAEQGLDPSRVAVGAGSVGMLQQLCLAYAGPGDDVTFSWPSFEAYPVLAAVAGATARTAPLQPWSLSLDLDALAGCVTERTRLVLLADPNNPTGTAVGAADLDRFLDRIPSSTLVVLDRAYHEFVTAADAAEPAALLAERPNLCVLRTFSKAHGLAALRVGYLLGPPEVVEAVDRTLAPFAVNGLGQAAALACLEPPSLAELRLRTAAITAERARFARELRTMGIPVAEPQGNFVWVPGLAVEPVGVATRVFPEGTRITVGSAADVDRALDAIAATALPPDGAPIRAQGWLDRLDAVERRLIALVAAGERGGLSEPDPGGEERWGWGQAWAHVGELGGYWLAQLELVLRGAPRFGRTKSDPRRVAAIEAGRHSEAAAHLVAARQAMARLRRLLAGMDEASWAATSEHPTLGAMDVGAFLSHFLVGHYEEHAAQIAALR